MPTSKSNSKSSKRPLAKQRRVAKKTSPGAQDLALLYVPCPSQEIAKDLATQVLQARLAACANWFSPSTSMYWWKGKLESTQECILILKTTKRLSSSLTKKILKHHPYSTPAILSLRVDSANSEFVKWTQSQVDCAVLRQQD